MSLDVFSHEPGRRSPARRVCPDPERKRRLNERVQENILRGGARVQSQSEFDAVIVTGKRANHVLHLLLTLALFFVGFFFVGPFSLILALGWIVVWMGVAGWSGEKRAGLTVDKFGAVSLTRLRS